MARVVSLTLFILSWLFVFSYASSIPSIDCKMCEKVMHQINQQMQEKKAQKLEVSVLEIIENVCDHRKQEARWIWQINSVEKLLEKGKCNSECKAIERECQQVTKQFDQKEVAQLTNRQSDDELVKRLCHDLFPDACAKDIIQREKPSTDADMVKDMNEEYLGQYNQMVSWIDPKLRKYRGLAAVIKPFKKMWAKCKNAINKDGEKSEL